MSLQAAANPKISDVDAQTAVHYSPTITHESFTLRIPSIPSTIQFRLAHPPPHSDKGSISAADIPEADLVNDGDDKAYNVISQLISNSPLAAKMRESEDLDSIVWEIIDSACDFINSEREEGVLDNKIWIVNVAIEEQKELIDNSSSYDGGGAREEEEEEVGGEYGDVGYAVKEDEPLVKETETASRCDGHCAICRKGIPIGWPNDYCANQNCPSRRTALSTLRLDVVC